MAFKLLELYADVTAKGVSATGRAIDGIRPIAQRVDRAISGLAGKIKWAFAIGAPVAIGHAIREMARFETQMAMVSTMLSGKGMQAMAGFRREVQSLAIEYGESTEALSKGLYDILSASVPAEQAIGVLKVATEAAKAGFTDAGTAVDGLTSLLNAYQLSADKAGIVSDLMFATVKRGKLTFCELAAVIGRVAPMAKAAGMSMQTMLAALATMTRQGIKADEAAVRLVAILKALPSAGRDLHATMQQFVGKSLEQIQMIVPDVRGAGGLAALSQDIRGLQADIEGMASAGGARMEAFLKVSQTTEYALARSREAVKHIERTLAVELAPTIDKVSRAFTDWLTGPGGKGALEDLADAIGEIVFHIGQLDLTMDLLLLKLEQKSKRLLDPFDQASRGRKGWQTLPDIADIVPEDWLPPGAREEGRNWLRDLLGFGDIGPRAKAEIQADIDKIVAMLADARVKFEEGLSHPGSQRLFNKRVQAFHDMFGGLLSGGGIGGAGAGAGPGSLHEQAKDFQEAVDEVVAGVANGRNRLEAIARGGRVELLEALGLGKEAEIARIDEWLRTVLDDINQAIADAAFDVEGVEELRELMRAIAAARKETVLKQEKAVVQQMRTEWMSGEGLIRQIQSAIGEDAQRKAEEAARRKLDEERNAKLDQANKLLAKLGMPVLN